MRFPTYSVPFSPPMRRLTGRFRTLALACYADTADTCGSASGFVMLQRANSAAALQPAAPSRETGSATRPSQQNLRPAPAPGLQAKMLNILTGLKAGAHNAAPSAPAGSLETRTVPPDPLPLSRRALHPYLDPTDWRRGVMDDVVPAASVRQELGWRPSQLQTPCPLSDATSSDAPRPACHVLAPQSPPASTV